MLRTGKVLGRSAKTAPFWMRIRWAREWVPTKIERREPMERVMSGPYLDLRDLRTGSRSGRELVSKSRVEARRDGPGGRVLVFRWLRLRRSGLIRAAMQTETTMMNQVSMGDDRK
ncbi:hypothetical protein R6Q59_002563 [Mikania micrantha]